MWVPFNTYGEVKGRVRGVSVPQANGQVLVWTDRGLFSLWAFRSAFVSTVASAAEAHRLFDPATGTLTWNGTAYPMLGGCAPDNDPRPFTRHPGGERVALDPDEDAARVLDASGAVRQTIAGVGSASEPWAVACFGPDGKALVLADPGGVRAFRYAPTAGAEQPRWAAVAGAGDQSRLLRAILNDPEDDTARLVYADWLDEHDDPTRAEFVRVQCRLAERMGREAVPGGDPDQRRDYQLRTQMGERWLAELPPVRGVRWNGFWRGFAAVSVVSPTTLVRAAPKVWAAAPVQAVTITGLNATGGRALAASEVLERVRVLTLDRYSTRRDGARPLCDLLYSPRVAGLRRLTLTYGIGEEGLVAVAESPHLTGLEWLGLGAGATTDAVAEAVLASPALRNLRGGSFVSHLLSDRWRERLKARFPNASV
ncbi:MAG: TIGR02996 domain-containing protein [Planctomycetes bacterium]|nr:TIGR02996 domain-containing protein [Planctomycetota bacterium]